MSSWHRFLRLTVLLFLALGLVPQSVSAADANANRIAVGVRAFSDLLDTLGGFEELGESLPLTEISLSSDKALGLSTLFEHSLKGALQDPALVPYTSLEELRDALDAADGRYGGVEVAIDNVSVEEDWTESHLINVDLVISAQRTIELPLAFSHDILTVSGGGVEVDLALELPLSFQLDTSVATLSSGEAFYLVNPPTLALSVEAHGAEGEGASIGAINASLGFTEITLAGELALDLDFAAQFSDPNEDGRLTQSELDSASLADLVQVSLADDPSTDAIAAALSIDSTLITGAPDGTISYEDDSLEDGLAAPSADFSALRDFTQIDPAAMLEGLAHMVAGLLTTQVARDPKLPFTDKHLGDAFAFAQPLLDFVKRQADGVVLCGSEDTSPPFGDLTEALPGDTIYCQTIGLQNPTAGSVTWSIDPNNGSVLSNGSGAGADATVGVKPTANASFILHEAGPPKLHVQFSDEAGSHTVYPRFRSAQDLFAMLAELGGFDDPSNEVYYDAATKSLYFHLVKTVDPDPISGTLDFGDQLRSVNLAGLNPRGGASVTIDPGAVTLDITLGVVLVNDVNNVDGIGSGGTVADRFFLKVRPGAGEDEFSASASVDGTLELGGTIGFVDVTLEGNAAANAANPTTAFEIAPADAARPLLAINIDAPGIPVAGASPFNIPNAVRLSKLLSTPTQYLDADCNVKMSGGLEALAQIGDSAFGTITGTVGLEWPQVFDSSCLPQPDGVDGLQITADTNFEEKLQNLDINPIVSGRHTGTTSTSQLVDEDRNFSTALGLVGSTLRNKTDNSTCTVARLIDNNTVECFLSGGSDNQWENGDAYEGGGNPLELLSIILDHLDELANAVDHLAGTGLTAALDKQLPVVGVSPRELLSHFDKLKTAIRDIKNGTQATVVCGTTNADPPTGSVTTVNDGSKIYCQATTSAAVSDVQWSVTPGRGSAGANTNSSSSDATIKGSALQTAGTNPSARAELTIDDGNAGTATSKLGTDFTVLLEYSDTFGRHTAEYPPLQPSSLQKLEQLLESKLGIPKQAFALELQDLPAADSGSETGDGVQDLVIRLGYGLCSKDNEIIGDCAPTDRTVEKLHVPLNLNLGERGLVEVTSSSSLDLEFAASARLDLAIPLPRTFSPSGIAVIDTTGVSLRAGALSEDLNLSTSVGPLTLQTGTGVTIISGTHDGVTSTNVLSDSTTDFTALPPDGSIGVPVGAVLRNTTKNASCVITAVAEHALSCELELADGTPASWENGNAYSVSGAGTIKLGAGFSLHKDGIDTTDDNETFSISAFAGDMTASFDRPENQSSCGNALVSGSPEPLTGDACGKLSLALDVSGSSTYLGDVDFRIDDITQAPDELSDFDGWYVAPPANLESRIASTLMDWTLLLRALAELTGDLAEKLDGVAQETKIPLVGNALDGGAEVALLMSQGLDQLATLGDEIKAVGNVDPDGDIDVEDVRLLTKQKILQFIGPNASGVKLLLDNDNDDDVDEEDVGVTIKCRPPGGGGTPTEAHCADGTSPTEIDDIRLTLKLGQVAFDEELPFDIGLDGLPLRAAGNVRSQGGWSLLVDFGLSRTDGPYLMAGEDEDDPELSVGADVTLGETNDAACNQSITGVPNISDSKFKRERCLIGEIGFLRVVLQDGGDTDPENANDPDDNDDPTRVGLSAFLDLESTGDDEKLTIQEIVSGGAVVQPGFEAGVNVDLRFRTGLADDNANDMPSVIGSFHFEWAYNTETGTTPSELSFGDLNLDAGAFVSKFLTPIAKSVKKITGPLQPVIDAVTTPLPVLSDLAELAGEEPITLLSLLEVNGNNVEMIRSIIGLISFINSIPTDQNFLIPLGANDQGGLFKVNFGTVQQGPVTSDKADQLVEVDPDHAPGTGLSSKLSTIREDADDAGGAFGVKGLSFPFLDNATQIFGLLMGKDVTLIRYEPPTMRASAGLSYTFPPIVIGPVPVSIGISLAASIEGRFAVAYDTSGIRQVIDGGSADKLLNGIYIDDLNAQGVDVPEIRLIGTVTVAAAVELGVVAVGVDGGIEIAIGMNLNDDPNPDGKLRIQEIVNKLNNPMCLFDIEGSVDAFLGAFVRIGFGFLSKKFRIEIVRIRLIDFTIDLCEEPVPDLGFVNGDGQLVLKMGPHASGRNVADGEVNDEFVVRQLNAEGTKFRVSAFGANEEIEGVTATGIKVVGIGDADGETGNDVVTLQAGTGDDGQPIQFTASADLRMGPGNDSITSGWGNDTLHGDAGDDRINGGPGVDTIVGGDNNDTLSSQLGDDTVEGNGGDDVLDGGPGADTLNGGDGDDAIVGGASSEQNPDLGDTIIGGAGLDTLEGGLGGDHIYGDEELGCGDAGSTDAATSADDLNGGPGDDLLYGGAGNDRIFGYEGLADNDGDGTSNEDEVDGADDDGDGLVDEDPSGDFLCGNAGDDLLDGDDESASTPDGNDTLQGGAGNDELYGRGGHDLVQGGADNDRAFGGLGHDDLIGGAGRDLLYGEAGNDIVLGDDGTIDDHTSGHGSVAAVLGIVTPGDDAAVGTIDCAAVGADGGNADCLFGGDGDDYLFGEGGHDKLWGDDLNGGNDQSATRADYLEGNAGDDELRGGQQNDTLHGNAGEDLLYGDSGEDMLFGDEDDDQLNGNGGDDSLFGGSQDDLLHGDSGDDYLEGNQDADHLFGDGGSDDLIGGSSTAGTADANDTLEGGVGYDALAGDNATIERPGGSNTFDESPIRTITLLDLNSADAALSGEDELYGDEDNDLLYGQGSGDLLHGDSGDDHLEGNAGGDTLYGDLGQDDLIGGSSAAVLHDGADEIWGGDGSSVLDEDYDVIAGDNATITRPLDAGLWQINSFNGAVTRDVTLHDVAVAGGPSVDAALSAGDTIYGEHADDLIYGQGGNDGISGGDGDDYLEGNAGDDTISGDAGDDDIVGGTGRINDDGPAGVAGRLDGQDIISGGAGYDVLAGDNALLVRTLFNGQWQQNTFNGGIVHNARILLDIDSANTALVSGNDGISGDGDDDLIYGQGGGDLISGGDGDDVVEGNAGGDTISGGDGQDDLIGGTIQAGLTDGQDVIAGDAAADVLLGDNGTITRPLDGAGLWVVDPARGDIKRAIVLFDVELAGGPSKAGFSAGDQLFGHGGQDQLFGQGGGDELRGGDAFDYLEGNHGGDTLYGDAGEDDLIGGGSAGDGVIGGPVKGDNLLDGDDIIYGDDQDAQTADEGDVLAGDNASITRPVTGGAWSIDPNSGDVVRAVVLYDVERAAGPAVAALASGSDRMAGEGGRDLLYGQGNSPSDADGDGRFDEDPADGVDNDRDGREGASSTGYDCADGRDNDGDGQLDAADAACATRVDEDGGGDELRGGDGVDYLEGNHGSDWLLGGAGEDDLIGGSSAGDGIIGGAVAPTNLLDDDDTISAGDEDDVVLADNGTIRRPTGPGGLWQRLTSPVFDLAVRNTTMAQSPEQPVAFGEDYVQGDAGHDDLYGQLGDDFLSGGHGEDALVGDLGLIANSIETGARQQVLQSQQPFLEVTIYPAGSLFRQTTLYSASTAAGAGGNDILLGGDGDDSLHGGHGDDLINGDGDGDPLTGADPVAATLDADRLFGGDGADVLWGGRGDDHSYGGYGADAIDVKPRPAMTGFAGDPVSWFTYGRVDHYQGTDIDYGGWDPDALQADVGSPGPTFGDRLIDWSGAYNVYYVCGGAYGEGIVTRLIAPDLVTLLQRLSEADGALATAQSGTSGFRELGMVFNQDVKKNTSPVHPDHPGHFVCN